MPFKRDEDLNEKPGVVHITFGTAEFESTLERVQHSAKKFGIRDIRIYRPDHPAFRRAVDENPEIMRQPRGAGYWLWKPYIILDTISNVEPGTVVIYADGDNCYIADPAPLIALAATRDVVLFDNKIGRLQRIWTKRDCFVLMDADVPLHWNRRQLASGVVIFRAGPRARQFFEEWKSAMRDPRALTDAPNVCGLPNFDGFIEHRHDQSILTILAVKHQIESSPR